MKLYVHPVLVSWNQVIPVDYPFIHIKGPQGSEGVLLVFNTIEAYNAYSNGDGYKPLEIEWRIDGKQDERNGAGAIGSEVHGWGRGSQGGASGAKADGVAGRRDNDKKLSNVGSARSRRPRR